MSRKNDTPRNRKTKKLTRAQKKEIDAVIRKYKGDGKLRTAQATIPYEAIYPTVCAALTDAHSPSALPLRTSVISWPQPETRTAIFEHLCDLYNYVDASIHVQLSFLNRKVDPGAVRKKF